MSRAEREPFGITYDRYKLDHIFKRLSRIYPIYDVLELGAGGAKSMPSIYSLGFGKLKCQVHLFNSDDRGIEVWKRLGFDDRLTLHYGDEQNTGLESDNFDLVWNFVTLGLRPNFEAILQEMVRVSQGYVMTVHMNGYNYGYLWHRFLHKIFKIPWNHGRRDTFFPKKIKKAHKKAGLEVVKCGFFDAPGWPDPPGFRDLRLHLQGVEFDSHQSDVTWTAPIEDYYRNGTMSTPLKILSRIEDLPKPTLMRYPVSHLFYVFSQVSNKGFTR